MQQNGCRNFWIGSHQLTNLAPFLHLASI